MAKVLVCTLAMGSIAAEQRDWALALVQDRRHELVFTRSKGKPTSSNRNKVARVVRREPSFDYLLTVDADVVPPVRVLDYVSLAEARDYDVVVFPTYIWQANQNADHPVVLNIALEDQPARWVDKRQRVLEVAQGGTGAMLIARRVLEDAAMRAPFEDGFDEDGVRNHGHDLRFCDRARAAGFRVWAAMDCTCSHYKRVDLAEVSRLLRRKRAYAEAFVSPRQALDGVRLVFCLSPGRCGTRYLAMVLGTIPGVVARHEPAPRFSNVNGMLQAGAREVAYQFWLERKLPAILSTVGSRKDAKTPSIYVETSHVLGQGFLKPLLDMGVVPDGVVLERDAREVALSYWRRDSVPGRTKAGKTYLLWPPASTDFADSADVTGYQLCYWHAVEMARRAREQAGVLRAAGALVYRASMKDVVTREGFAHLVSYLQIGEPDWVAYERMAHEQVNATPAEVRERMPVGDLEAQEAEVRVWMESES